MKRIQRKRTKGWRLPPDTVCVTRPGPHGNPYHPNSGYGMGTIDADGIPHAYDNHNPAHCVHMFKLHARDMKRDQPARYQKWIAPLRGKDLACWCAEPKVGEPDVCHGAILLELANEKT